VAKLVAVVRGRRGKLRIGFVAHGAGETSTEILAFVLLLTAFRSVVVAVKATIVRAVLLPATMKLLGRWNWYLPRWLEWLSRVSHAPAPAALEGSGA
jgi:uncharacterized membrane protein YdfJ with MMPL/SSD domain